MKLNNIIRTIGGWYKDLFSLLNRQRKLSSFECQPEKELWETSRKDDFDIIDNMPHEARLALSYAICFHCALFVCLMLVVLLIAQGCGMTKIEKIQKEHMSAQIGLVEEAPVRQIDTREIAKPDTLIVRDDDGTEMIIMKAVKDEDGEMVATDVINAAVVEARFRNVAERHGLVDIEFQIKIPKDMQDAAWQLRFYPDMYILEDSLRLESVIITGENYRMAQLRGYEQYDKYLASLVTDTTKFINMHLLELFIQRNIPDLYAYKTDTSEVTDNDFSQVLNKELSGRFRSHYGVTAREAIDHYTNILSKSRNARRWAKKDKMYRKYVKVPIEKEGIRLDTVIRTADGDFIYNYVQTIRTRPKLRKVDVILSGEIYEQDKRIYEVPATEPLTYYISSLSAFVDNTPRYKKRIVNRRVEANTACYIDFAKGSSEVDPTLGYNANEISRIKGNLSSLLENKDFDLDSIVVTASCSPEGSLRLNKRLSSQRSDAVSEYFKKYMKRQRDSLHREEVWTISLDEEIASSRVTKKEPDIKFISRSNPENWRMLDALVGEDTVLTKEQKVSYLKICEIDDLDERESRLQGESVYKYYRETLYPRLRTVKFDFHLHRKGMVQDTLVTTVLDEDYMEGVQAIRDRDFEKAIQILRPYHDYNTAVAYCAMDYNASALDILMDAPRTDQVNYMLAVLYGRQGDDRQAVEYYLKSCKQNPSFIHRGNLDPEISRLIKTYGLNKQDEEDDYSSLGF